MLKKVLSVSFMFTIALVLLLGKAEVQATDDLSTSEASKATNEGKPAEIDKDVTVSSKKCSKDVPVVTKETKSPVGFTGVISTGDGGRIICDNVAAPGFVVNGMPTWVILYSYASDHSESKTG